MRIFPLCLVLAFLSSSAMATTLHGVEFAEYVTLANGKNVALRGVGKVDQRFLPGFVVALYASPEASAEELLRGRSDSRFEIHWLAQKADNKVATEFWREGLDIVFAEPMTIKRLAPTVKKFCDALGSAQRGDVWQFEYDPSTGLRVTRNLEESAHFVGVEFNRALIAIWLGPKAPNQLSSELLSNSEPIAVQQ